MNDNKLAKFTCLLAAFTSGTGFIMGIHTFSAEGNIKRSVAFWMIFLVNVWIAIRKAREI